MGTCHLHYHVLLIEVRNRPKAPEMGPIHEIDDPTNFWLSWDPTDSEDIRLLQKYTESNGSVVSQAAQ